MLSCLSGDSFSNQRKKTGTHLYSFFVVSQDLWHFSMSVKLDLNLNHCHETNNGE